MKDAKYFRLMQYGKMTDREIAHQLNLSIAQVHQRFKSYVLRNKAKRKCKKIADSVLEPVVGFILDKIL